MLQRIAATFSAIMIASVMAGSASAADPTGSWMVEGGFAHIKIDTCGNKLWGIVAWEQKPNIDRNNPDASKRTRPTLGLPILLGMAQSKPNQWDGEIYNSEDGRTYTAHIGLTSDNVLRVEGCVLGFLCGGQSWTRVETPQQPAPAVRASNAKPAPTPAPPPKRTTGQATVGPASTAPQTSDVCQAVATATGQPLDQLVQSGRR
jgi:uncharacterized protein (DUF2147 family)